MTFSPNGRYIAVGFDYHAYILDQMTNKRFAVAKLSGYSLSNNQKFFRFSPDSTRVVCLDKTESLWDIANQKKLTELKINNRLSGPVFSPNGKFIMSVSGRECHVWNTKTGEKLQLDNNGYHAGLFKLSLDRTRFVEAKRGNGSVAVSKTYLSIVTVQQTMIAPQPTKRERPTVDCEPSCSTTSAACRALQSFTRGNPTWA